MTKFVDWINFKNMSSKDKANVNTSSTFAEAREEKEVKPPVESFGLGKNENKAKK